MAAVESGVRLRTGDMEGVPEQQCNAWDTLTWFAALIGMASYLNKYGFIKWFSGKVCPWPCWQPHIGMALGSIAKWACLLRALYTVAPPAVLACKWMIQPSDFLYAQACDGVVERVFSHGLP